MNAKQFDDELKAIVDETREKVVELVNRAQADEGLDSNTDMPVSFCEDPAWEYRADDLAQLAGFIYDRMRGRNRLHKQSVTKKIRKALGYTYP